MGYPILTTAESSLTGNPLFPPKYRLKIFRPFRGAVFCLMAMATIGCIDHVWPSRANFLLVRFRDLPAVIDYLAGRRILVRDFGSVSGLAGCARITIGSRAENDALLAALADFGGRGQ